MNYEELLTQEKINELSMASIQQFSTLPFEEAFVMVKELIRIYPNSESLKLRIAANWLYIQMLVKEENHITTYQDYAISLLRDIMHSTTFEIRQNAGILLSNLYCLLERYDEAEEVLHSLPTTDQTIDALSSIYVLTKDYEKAIHHIQTALYSTITKACTNLTYLKAIAKNTENNDEVQIYQKLQHDVQRLFHIPITPSFEKSTKKETTIQNLTAYIHQLMHYDEIKMSTLETIKNTPWFSQIEFHNHSMIKGLMKQKLSLLLEDEKFQDLRDEEAFKKLVEEVKQFEEKTSS